MDVLGRRVAPGELAGVSVFGRVMACTQVRGRVHRRRTGDPIILRTREISNCFSMQRTLEATNSGARHLPSRERNRLYVTQMIVKRT